MSYSDVLGDQQPDANECLTEITVPHPLLGFKTQRWYVAKPAGLSLTTAGINNGHQFNATSFCRAALYVSTQCCHGCNEDGSRCELDPCHYIKCVYISDADSLNDAWGVEAFFRRSWLSCLANLKVLRQWLWHLQRLIVSKATVNITKNASGVKIHDWLCWFHNHAWCLASWNVMKEALVQQNEWSIGIYSKRLTTSGDYSRIIMIRKEVYLNIHLRAEYSIESPVHFPSFFICTLQCL